MVVHDLAKILFSVNESSNKKKSLRRQART